MKKEYSLNDVFEKLFKFNINTSVKHKAQDSYSEDLFILARSINQEETAISLTYQCRLMSSNKAGHVITFLENELISVNDFEDSLVKTEYAREKKRESGREQIKEIYEYFGIDKTKTYIKKDADNSMIQYKLSGCFYKDKECFIILRPIIGQGIEEYLEVNKQDFDKGFLKKAKGKLND